MFRVWSNDNITIHDFIRIPFLSFSLSGMKLFEWEGMYTNTYRNIILLVFMLANGFLTLAALISFVVFKQYEDFIELAEMSSYFWFGINCLSKMASMWLNRHSLRKVLTEMKSTFPRNAADRDAYKLRDCYSLSNRHMWNLSISHYTVMVLILATPLIRSAIDYYTTNAQFTYMLPYKTMYPFDVKQPLPYILTFISHIIVAIGSMSFFLGSDSMLICTVHLLNMHFVYLNRRIEDLKPQCNEYDVKELTDLLEFHNVVLDYSERINSIFSISILMNYVISVVNICMISFQVVAGSHAVNLIVFSLFLLMSLYANFIISSVGTDLLTLSADVGDGLSSHPWYNANLKYQRLLPLAIARAQRPAHLSAYKFFIISMESFKTMMTTSYQFCTLLKTRYDETVDSGI